MKLCELAAKAVEYIRSTTDFDFSTDEVYRLLDVRGTRNLHLANPLNRDPNVYYFRPRTKSLTGEEAVFGDHLSLTFCGHDPFVILQDHDDIDSLKALLLSDSGPFSFLITGIAAFVEGRLMPYRLLFRRRDGLVAELDKFDQYVGAYHPRETFEGRQLEWTSTLGQRSCGFLVVRGEPISEFLLLRHRDRWDLPKGHIEPGETEIDCALRELVEETGITADDIEIIPGFRFKTHYQVRGKRDGQFDDKTLVIFLARLKREDISIALSEHPAYQWFAWQPPHQIQAWTIDPLLEELAKFLNQQQIDAPPPQTTDTSG